MKLGDLNARAGTVYVRNGKGSKGSGPIPRTIGLDPEAFASIDAWLAHREDLPGNGKDALLFVTLDGGPLDGGYCRAMLARVAKRAGITGRAHLHGLRHLHAVQAIRDGRPLHEVQAQLGHASLATTSIYLAHVTPEDLAAGARARPSWNVDALPTELP